MLWAWGLAGAFVYAQAALIFELWNAGQTRAGRYKAVAEFVAALITGAIFAEGLTVSAQKLASPWIKADAVAVALTIGWLSNYLWPRLLKRIGKRLEDRVDDAITKGPPA